MSNENQNKKVDYQDLFNSLVKENENKESIAEKTKPQMKRKQKNTAPPGAKRKKKPVQDDMQNTRVI